MPTAKKPICKHPALSKQEFDFLYRLYVVKDMTGPALAEKLGCPMRTLYMRLKALGIDKSGKAKPAHYCETCGQALPKSVHSARPKRR